MTLIRARFVYFHVFIYFLFWQEDSGGGGKNQLGISGGNEKIKNYSL